MALEAQEATDAGELCVFYLRRRADRKIRRALRIESLRLAGLTHGAIREQLNLSVEQYRRARQWLRNAVALSVGSAEPLSVEEALREYGAHHVATAIRLGALAQDGYTRTEIIRILRLSIEEYEAAHEWLRDARGRDPDD